MGKIQADMKFGRTKTVIASSKLLQLKRRCRNDRNKKGGEWQPQPLMLCGLDEKSRGVSNMLSVVV